MTRAKKKIRITRTPIYPWYAGKRGEVFDVYEFDSGGWYVVADDYDRGAGYPWRWIPRKDCEEVE